MYIGWLGLIFAVAFLDWYAVWTENEKMNRFTKPAAMLALLFWTGLCSRFQGQLLWFGLAVFFGLLGDIFLLLPKKFFGAGLLSFLIGHVLYVVGFGFPPAQFRLPHFIIILVLGTTLAFVAPKILGGFKEGYSKMKKLKIPVMVYMLIISLMVFSAASTLFDANWEPAAAGLAVSGAILFFCSDSMLAYREFVHAFPKARFWVRVTYHLGQIALVASAVLNFVK